MHMLTPWPRQQADLTGTERVSLPPKPPPRRLVLLNTLCAGRPSTCATMFWFFAGPCACAPLYTEASNNLS